MIHSNHRGASELFVDYEYSKIQNIQGLKYYPKHY